MTTKSTDAVIWSPPAETVAEANLTAFMRRHGIADYAALVSRSEADPDWFWNAVIAHFDLRFTTPYARVMDDSDGMPWTKWCVGGTTNIVIDCLDRHRETSLWQRQAIAWEGEDGARRGWTYAELDAETCRLANALRALGLGKGDVVALYLPMVPEAAAAYLAVAKIGGIILPLFSGFGAGAVAVRCNDGGAKAIMTADGTMRRGKIVRMKDVLDEAAVDIPTLRHIVVLRHLALDIGWQDGRDQWWHGLTAAQPDTAETQDVAADDPHLLVFTSGTTGKAKGAVLTHCGFSTKLALDFGLCLDFKDGDRILWMSDIGWLVGPILIVGATMLGGTIIMAEGAPDYPQKGRLWRLIEDFEVSFLGLAPTIVRLLMGHGRAEVEKYDLSTLRVIASTGEPWNPDSWLWCFHNVGKSKVPLLNYSGGTEIGGGILTGTVLHPLKPCSFAGAIPGMGADVVDETGKPVAPGEVGELVLRLPSIGLTRGLWNDRERYLDSYWRKIPGLWVHGDFASIDADGFWYVHGRSDDTLKIAGKRTGPAEIESLLLATGKIAEAAAIGVPDEIKGQALVCVCVARAPSPELAAALSDAVAGALGTPFRPREIVFVTEIPMTRNMKIMRRVVRAIYTNEDPGDLSSLVNPGAIDALKAVLRRR